VLVSLMGSMSICTGAPSARKGEALLSDGQPNREYGAPRL
jgi:hypothetical protein